MKCSVIVQNWNKGAHVYRAVAGALSQNIPCDIVIGDAQSTDNSLAEIHRAVAEAPRGAEHDVRVLVKPTKDEGNFRSATDTTMWLAKESTGDWILQCSSDDYSLPDRARVCMEAVAEHPCSIIATTMYFDSPDGKERAESGYPKESGYVSGADGLTRLAYGSVIAGYSREFLDKCGHMMVGDHTPDVLMGFLASLDKGFYVVAQPCHVHVQHADLNNLGFQGRMRAAQGENALRLGCLNHFQLLDLFTACFDRAYELHPEGIDNEDYQALMTIILGQSRGWLQARKKLHEMKIQPWGMHQL